MTRSPRRRLFPLFAPGVFTVAFGLTEGCHGGGSSSLDSMGTTGTSDSDGTTIGDTETGHPGVDIVPAAGGARRLIRREYIATVEYLLGSRAAAAATPPADIPQNGFNAVGGALLALDANAVERYETSANDIADAAVANLDRLAAHVPCVTEAATSSCYVDLARDFGRLAYRRPLAQDEIDDLVAVAQHANTWSEDDFIEGVRYLLRAVLQAPSFLYLIEVGEPDETSGYRRLTAYELASRMSIVLLGRGPDASLLDAAQAGELSTPEGIRKHATRMVQSPSAKEAVAGFFEEYLRLGNLANDSKSAELFPLFSEELAQSMAQETQLLLEDIIWTRDADYRELFSADYTFVDGRLAELYGIAPPAQPDDFVQVSLPAEQKRAGYLTHASFLTHQAGSTKTSPTKRGVFIQQRVLCNEIPPPPANVNSNLPEIPPDATLRDILLLHMENPACSCHRATDPLGLAFENYDAVGAFRRIDNGQTIDASGALDDVGQWNNALDLSALLAEDPRTSACLINNFVRGGLGHRETAGEAHALAQLDTSFGDAGYSIQQLLVEFTASPVFQLVDEPK